MNAELLDSDPELLAIVSKVKKVVCLLRGIDFNFGDALKIYRGYKERNMDPKESLKILKEMDISEGLGIDNYGENLYYDDEINRISKINKHIKMLALSIRNKGDFLSRTSSYFDFVERNLNWMLLLKLEYTFSTHWIYEGKEIHIDCINNLYTLALKQLDVFTLEEKQKIAIHKTIIDSKSWIDFIFEIKFNDTRDINKMEVSSYAFKNIDKEIIAIENIKRFIEKNTELENALSGVLDYLMDAHNKLCSFQDLYGYRY